MDLIHSDVYGPMSNKSLGGHLYCVTSIDDYSRKTWIYFLKTKDEVFEMFWNIKTQVENATERRIKSKTLRSDNGGEYIFEELIAFCKDAGIKREMIVLYTT